MQETSKRSTPTSSQQSATMTNVELVTIGTDVLIVILLTFRFICVSISPEKTDLSLRILFALSTPHSYLVGCSDTQLQKAQTIATKK
ncbi:hypothetical protein NUACC26_043440 [Scytonema sp. NUACC26]